MSFRKYGGLSYNSNHNMVNSLYNNTSILTTSNGIGLNNSYINVYSDLSYNTLQDSYKNPKNINFSKNNYESINISYDWKTKFFINGGSNNESLNFNVLHPNEFDINKIYPITYEDSDYQKRIGLMTSEKILKDPNEYDFNKIDVLGLLGVLVKEIQILKSVKFNSIVSSKPLNTDNPNLTYINTAPNYKTNASYEPITNNILLNLNKIIPVNYTDEKGIEKIGILSNEKKIKENNKSDNIDLIGLIGILTLEVQELKKKIELLSKN